MRLHPRSSSAGHAAGQAVELFNAAGTVGLYALLTTDVPPGMWWWKGIGHSPTTSPAVR